jgi:hypothetical protein
MNRLARSRMTLESKSSEKTTAGSSEIPASPGIKNVVRIGKLRPDLSSRSTKEKEE